MIRHALVLLLALLALGSASPLYSQTDLPEGWTPGPTVGALGSQASVSIPQGVMFLHAAATKAFLEQNENIPDGDELGAIVRIGEGDDYWFAVFSYSESGHVDDSDRTAIDADALMANLKKGSEQGNKERRSRGWDELLLEGWHQAPFYDEKTNNLTWSTRLTSVGRPVVNHSVRLLGRTGTMSVQLVVNPASIDSTTAQFNEVLGGYAYTNGQRYAQFVKGDKLAGYGLAALIAGGAGAAAVKSGFLQKFWKFLVMLVVGGAAGLKKLFGSRSERHHDGSDPRPIPVPPPAPVPPSHGA
jgi:uncharacterized membrane-anchored protein